MTRLFIDDTQLGAKLAQAHEPIELFDQKAGLVVGQYLPTSAKGKLIRPEDECPISEEELLRRLSEEGGRPLAEIWKSLGRDV